MGAISRWTASLEIRTITAYTLHIYLLGTFRLLRRDDGVSGFDQARLQELLAYLLLQRGRAVPRQQPAFLFWPDSPEEQARTNFRNLWHRLRRAIPDADRFLAADELAVEWRTDAPYWLDVAAFEDGLQRARAAVSTEIQIAALEDAVGAYGGDLLPGSYSDWLLAERERLAQAYGAALSQLAILYEEVRDYRQAIARSQALLRHDPLHEPAYAQLMRLHALNDDRPAALHTYHTCTTVLRRELDVEPGFATRQLYEQLLSGPQLVVPSQAETAIPLVGRMTEWARLQAAWRDAASSPHLLLISGEAGIGKTRLAEALAEWVSRQGIPVLAASCYTARGDLAYAPVVAWLRGHPRPPLADHWLRELARLLPEILIDHPELPPPAPMTEKWQRLHLFEALQHALLAGRKAQLLCLEDLQWCDRDTLDWIHFLLTARPNIEPCPQLLIVATLRSEESPAGSVVNSWRTELFQAHRLTEIEIGPLSQDATLALADRVAGRPFDPAVGPLLYQDTEGNPLFTVEMVRAGFVRQTPTPAETTVNHSAPRLPDAPPLPARVRQVLEARLNQLSTTARTVVDVAAVIGRAFTYDVLVGVSDLKEERLVTALDECWRKRIIREQDTGAYDFSHDKLRETAYFSLSQTRRRWLHGRVAQALERLHAGSLDRVAGVIAEHFDAAGQPGRAIAYYERSAALARQINAYGEALAALERAIHLVTAFPDRAAHRVSPARLQEALGDLRELLTQHHAAREAYHTARSYGLESDTVMQARLQRKIGKTLEREGAGYAQVAARYAEAEALLGAPGEVGEAAWWEEWCQIQLEQILLLYWWNRPEDMAQRIATVQPSIERHGTPLQRALLFSNFSRQVSRSTRFAPSDVAVANARAALAALPATVTPEIRAPHQFTFGFYLLWHGDLPEAEAKLSIALNMAEQIGDVSLQARCLSYLTVVYRRQGLEAETKAHARHAISVAESAGMLDYVGAGWGNLAWLAARRGNWADAERFGQVALAAWQQVALPYPFYWQALWPLIAAALMQDRLADAITHVRHLCEPTQQLLPSVVEEALVAALAAWEAGQHVAARDHLHLALDRVKQTNHF